MIILNSVDSLLYFDLLFLIFLVSDWEYFGSLVFRVWLGVFVMVLGIF